MSMCDLDYYAVLNVPRTATLGEICVAYRNLAIRLCPLRDNAHQRDFVPLNDPNEVTHMSPIAPHKQWTYINMAYDVLSNDLLRSVYDRYGEAGLLGGVVLPNGHFPPYIYHGDDMKVYHSVFGSYSPYANVIDAITNPPPLYANDIQGIGVLTKDPPVKRMLGLELEEIYFGCVKLMHVYRQEYIDDQQILTEQRKKTLTLEIPPGTLPGTCFTFIEEGDRSPTKIPGDIIFIAEDKPHHTYIRNNKWDLIYVHEIDLCEALTGFAFSLDTLDQRILNIAITEVVYPDYVKHIPCEGLPKRIVNEVTFMDPHPENRPPHGDLFIHFEIRFPRYLTREMKLLCREFFNELQAIDYDADEEDL